LHFTEVFYNNPDCKTQYEDLPYSAEYPSHGKQKFGDSFKVIVTYIGAGQDELL
jgi:hypothetical protein